ncbi:MAG: S-layer homology domain-containing protein [Candidatus Peribacteraceae bacterium]|nr:S-layer homology domain-containing protein [Candidatus Peribacteraceae bacterium]
MLKPLRLLSLLGLLTVPAITWAAQPGYADVPPGVWYSEAAEKFVEDGILDGSQKNFRPQEFATRAEFTKLIVALNGGILNTPPSTPSFDDVSISAWYFTYMEEAAHEKWIQGYDNCLGAHPCNAFPEARISRAEAAALIVRAFGLEPTNDAQQFTDNPAGQWYTEPLQTAADHCIVQGDESTGRVRPADTMNRAEMITMLWRADEMMTQGTSCFYQRAFGIENVFITSATTLEVELLEGVKIKSATDITRYTLTGKYGSLKIESATVLDASTVELRLGESIGKCGNGEEFTLSIPDEEVAADESFNSSETFTYECIIGDDFDILEFAVHPSDTPEELTVVRRGAQNVDMLALDITAGCQEDYTVDSIMLNHEGNGSNFDIVNVHASVLGQIAGNGTRLDNEGWNVRFGPVLSIPACKTITVWFRADISTVARPQLEHVLSINSSADISSSGRKSLGQFPIRSTTFRVR